MAKTKSASTEIQEPEKLVEKTISAGNFIYKVLIAGASGKFTATIDCPNNVVLSLNLSVLDLEEGLSKAEEMLTSKFTKSATTLSPNYGRLIDDRLIVRKLSAPYPDICANDNGTLTPISYDSWKELYDRMDRYITLPVVNT